MPPRAHFIYLYAPSPYYTVYRACVVCIFPRFNIYRDRLALPLPIPTNY